MAEDFISDNFQAKFAEVYSRELAASKNLFLKKEDVSDLGCGENPSFESDQVNSEENKSSYSNYEETSIFQSKFIKKEIIDFSREKTDRKESDRKEMIDSKKNAKIAFDIDERRDESFETKFGKNTVLSDTEEMLDFNYDKIFYKIEEITAEVDTDETCLDKDKTLWLTNTDIAELNKKETAKQVNENLLYCNQVEKDEFIDTKLKNSNISHLAKKKKVNSSPIDIESDTDFYVEESPMCDEERKFKCNICSKQFKLRHHLRQHSHTHTKARSKLDRMYKCPNCNSLFKMKHHLQRHILTHSKEKKFKCASCDKCYVDKHDLQKHITRHHLEMKTNAQHKNLNRKLKNCSKPPNFTCAICWKTFQHKKYLKTHLKVHCKLTPFECGFCKKVFLYKASLIEHTRMHTQEKPYECELCTKKFSTKSNLLRHTKSHFRAHFCRSCKSEFPDEEQLRLHTKTCTTEYECPQCSFQFNKLSNLKRHLKTHSKYNS